MKPPRQNPPRRTAIRVKNNHFVPIAAILRNFAAEGDTIWMYRRGEKPVLQTTRNVGKERFLYDQSTEKAFADLDGLAVPVMAMLNGLASSRELSPDTWALRPELGVDPRHAVGRV